MTRMGPDVVNAVLRSCRYTWPRAVSSSAFAWLLATAVAFASPGQTWAQSPGGPTSELSPALRAALIAEMQHLDTSLQRAVSAVARADWVSVERAALEIMGSFILEQSLSSEQLHELHRVLPEAFLALDREFHLHAERLASAAKGANAELAAFYTYKLTAHRDFSAYAARSACDRGCHVVVA